MFLIFPSPSINLLCPFFFSSEKKKVVGGWELQRVLLVCLGKRGVSWRIERVGVCLDSRESVSLLFWRGLKQTARRGEPGRMRPPWAARKD